LVVAIADVSAHGLVTRKELGETTVLVRFLHLQEPVRLAFLLVLRRMVAN